MKVRILADFYQPVTTYAGKVGVPQGAPPGTPERILEGGRQEERHFLSGEIVDLDDDTAELFIAKGLAETGEVSSLRGESV